MAARLDPYPTILQPPILQSPSRNPNFTDLLGSIAITQLPAVALTAYIPTGGWFFAGGATLEENATAGAGGLFIELNVINERAKTHIAIPTGVNSISGATLFYTESAEFTGTITVYSRSLTVGENINTGGSADNAAFSTFTAVAGEIGTLDVLTAFDGAGIGTGGDTLYVEVRATTVTAGAFGLVALRIVWA